MFEGLFFFTYIFAAFVGCIAILLVVLLAKAGALEAGESVTFDEEIAKKQK